jgi:hypothetical protein
MLWLVLVATVIWRIIGERSAAVQRFIGDKLRASGFSQPGIVGIAFLGRSAW